MAFFPDLPMWETATINTKAFLGLNRGLSIADGEMADMLNMSGDHYPVLSTRKPRAMHTWPQGGENRFATPPSGMLGTDRLILCHEDKVYMDGAEMPLRLSTDESMQPKHLVSMGAYVCIWPDKKYFNVTNPEDSGDMGRKWEPEGDAAISAMMCRKDGTNYDEDSITISDTAPAEPEDRQMWMDTSGETDVLKQYSAMHQEWIQVATTYIKIQADGIGKGLKESDVVHISGAKVKGEAATAAEAGTETLPYPTDDFHLYSAFNTTHMGGTNWVSSTANIAERTKTFKVEGIPEGAAVTSAVLKVTAGSSAYGAKLLTVNGTSIKEGQENEVPVEASGNGEYSFLFRFQSNNNANVSGQHGGSVSFTGVVLEITYEVTATPADSDVDFLNTTNILYGCGDNYIIVAGLLRAAVTLADSLEVELKIPDLDYVCEANNRIWGCSYAKIDGTLTNEIRCCALGDFRNWYRFEGTSMDSYVMSVGSDGKFTGAYSLQGVPLMWKEGFLHKISGTQPSNFTLNTLKCRGVQDGSWRSLAVVNETLMYKAATDVMAYDGAMPYSVSEKLGTERYYEAVGGAQRDKYYINMRDSRMKYSTYVLDTAKGLWYREDDRRIPLMASVSNELVMAVEEAGETLLQNAAKAQESANDQPWSATFGIFGFEFERSKYLSRFNIRAQMVAGSVMHFDIQYDSSGEWERMGTMKSRTLQTFTLPIIPRRCDHCQMRISGVGDVKIYSIARVFEEGGN